MAEERRASGQASWQWCSAWTLVICDTRTVAESQSQLHRSSMLTGAISARQTAHSHFQSGIYHPTTHILRKREGTRHKCTWNPLFSSKVLLDIGEQRQNKDCIFDVFNRILIILLCSKYTFERANIRSGTVQASWVLAHCTPIPASIDNALAGAVTPADPRVVTAHRWCQFCVP